MKKIVSFLMVFILVAMQYPTTPVKAEGGGIAWDGSIASAYDGGSGSAEDPYLIANGAQLALMAEKMNDGSEVNFSYQLTENIDLASKSWVPIGNSDFPFTGNFNGNGYSISNMKVGYIEIASRSARNEPIQEDTSRSVGVEVRYDPVTEALEQELASIKAELESVIAEEAAAQEATAASEETQAVEKTNPAEVAEAPGEAPSTDGVGNEDSESIRAAVAEAISSVESNVAKPSEMPSNFSLFSTQDPGYDGDAGLFGYFNSGIIEKVTVKDSEVIGRRYTGGIVGYSGVNAVIEHCYFDGTVDNSTVGHIGGIVGYAEGRVANCTNIGTIGGATPDSAFIGGIAGLTKNNIASCRNSGHILGNQSFLGGIAGKIDGSKLIMDSFNIGQIGSPDTVGSNSGGIVGRAPNGTLTRCANHGSVTLNSTDEDSFISGLAGDAYIITNAYNTGDVSGYWASGLGGVLTGGSLKNYNAGQISGGRNASITCLLESMGTVGRNSTYWRSGSASMAIRADAAYPYGGTPVQTSEAVMQSSDFVGVIGNPFISDDYLRNNHYPVIDGVEYFITAPQTPTEFQTGTFNYAGAREEGSPDIKKDYPQTYFYSDAYFEEKASLYNSSLATMSLCMVMSGFNSNSDASGTIFDENSKYAEKYKNAEKLLTDIGFTEIEANTDYKIKPSENSFGVITGHKEITVNGKNKTLIAQIGRGGNYGVEWSGNFMVGASGEHQGFAEGRDKAYGWLTNYINTHRNDPSFHEEDVVFWLTGYSRAAAVTNLLAGKMTTDLSIAGINYSNEDLYAYCLAPPMGALANESEAENRSYTNIHNVVNPNDFVPKVAPAAWDFTRYGVDAKTIPDRLTTSNGAIFTKMYKKLNMLHTDWGKELLDSKSGGYVLNDFQGKKLSIGLNENPETGENFLIKNSNIAMSKFLDLTMDLVADSIGSRQVYVNKYQATVSDLGGRVLGNPEEAEMWKTTVPECINAAIEENLPKAVDILLSPTTQENTLDAKKGEARNLIIDSVLEALKKEGIDLNKQMLSDTVGLLLQAGFNSLLSSGGSDIMTLFSNINLMAKPHYPELYFAWLQAHDPNYDGIPETYINTYRIASISGDADVSVYDESGALVAQIIDNEPEEIADSTIVASIETGNEKSIYLPADATYDVKVDAKGEGTVNYAVREYSGDTASYAKIVNYYDIPVTSGDHLEGVVPEFSSEDVANVKDGSSVSYVLEKSESTLAPSLEVKGEAAREALYAVTVTNNTEDKGLAFGTGTYCEGSLVQIVALPFEGKQFIGWYQGDKLISTDARYEFLVTQATSFTAVFD